MVPLTRGQSWLLEVEENGGKSRRPRALEHEGSGMAHISIPGSTLPTKFAHHCIISVGTPLEQQTGTLGVDLHGKKGSTVVPCHGDSQWIGCTKPK